MSAYDREGGASASAACGGLPPDLEGLYLHLNELLEGRRPEMAAAELRWLSTFNDVAARFDGVISRDDSYWLSFEALYRCHRKGKSVYDKYVQRACHRAHLDYLKRRRPTLPLPADHVEAVDHQAREDTRLDLEAALVTLGEANPHWQTVLRMRLAGHTYDEIAEELGVTARHAIRLTREAERRLRRLLASYGDENAQDD
jgi:DNA-directed RNA polymerase specialized sigma24 family protein